MKQLAQLSQTGFTIVELVLTILIGGVMAISVTTVVSENSHLAQKTRDRVAANSYVEGKVEELRSIGYSGLNLGATDIANELPADLKQPRSGTVQISSPSAGIKQADITITYNDQGSSQTYSYTTYIGELGVGQY